MKQQEHAPREPQSPSRRVSSPGASTVTLDARQVDPVARAEKIRELMWDSVVRVEIDHHPQPERIDFQGSVVELGKVRICSIRSNATAVRRTSRLAMDDLAPSLFLGLQVAGSSVVVQDGRRAVLHPGDLAVHDTTRPYTLLDDDGIHQHLFRVPLAELALPATVVSRVTAMRLSTDSPVADVAAMYFQRLATRSAYGVREAEALGRPSIELLRALITTQLPDAAASHEPVRASLQLRILDHVRDHLSDPDLSAALIARDLHVSVRLVYRVLASSDVSLGSWIRTQRLEECRKDLAKPAARYVTIAALARRWGFTDATSFGRAFKSAYGMSPRDWRQLRSADPVDESSGRVRSPSGDARGR